MNELPTWSDQLKALEGVVDGLHAATGALMARPRPKSRT